MDMVMDMTYVNECDDIFILCRYIDIVRADMTTFLYTYIYIGSYRNPNIFILYVDECVQMRSKMVHAFAYGIVIIIFIL